MSTRDTSIRDRIDRELMRDDASALTDHELRPVREAANGLDIARWEAIRSLRRAIEEKSAVLAVAADLERERNELRHLLKVWLTGDCPMYVEDCRRTHLCQHCFENAVIDFDLDAVEAP